MRRSAIVGEGAGLRGWPDLQSSGMRLRSFAGRDAPLVLEASEDPFIPLITTVPMQADAKLALEWVDRQRSRFAEGIGYSFCIARISDDAPLGQIGLWPHRSGRGRATIGYWVARSHRGAGVATAALRLISAWGATHPGVHRLELYVEPWNEGSWRAAEHVGFVREGLMRRWEAVGGERRDMFMYSLLPDDLGG